MPAAPAVKQLPAVRTQPREDVLEIGCRGRGGPERGGIERPSAESEHGQTEQAASDFEATIGDVLVRHSIAREMQWRTERERRASRAGQRTQRPAGRDMKGDDHDRSSTQFLSRLARKEAARPVSFRAARWRRNKPPPRRSSSDGDRACLIVVNGVQARQARRGVRGTASTTSLGRTVA
jgi:hypothetical protein